MTTPTRLPINKDDRYIMDIFTQVGYGWAKYACSIERQGWVSPAQRMTLIKMLNKLRDQQDHLRAKRISVDEFDISDQEAMGLGAFF